MNPGSIYLIHVHWPIKRKQLITWHNEGHDAHALWCQSSPHLSGKMSNGKFHQVCSTHPPHGLCLQTKSSFVRNIFLEICRCPHLVSNVNKGVFVLCVCVCMCVSISPY